MIFSWSLLALISFSATQVTSSSTPSKRTYGTHDYYALEYFPGPFGASLDEVTTALGVEVVEQVGAFKDTWLVQAEKPRELLGSREESFDLVLSKFERLQVQASSHITSRSEETLLAKRVVSSVTFLERQFLQELVKRAPPPPFFPSHSATSQEVADRLHLHDPLFKEQWHLVNDEHPEHMMNTTPVWDMGFSGKDVLVSYIDDGLDDQTEDLKDAFVRILYFYHSWTFFFDPSLF